MYINLFIIVLSHLLTAYAYNLIHKITKITKMWLTQKRPYTETFYYYYELLNFLCVYF